MIHRLQQFIESQEKNVTVFEKKIGASNGVIRKAIANNTDIQGRWLVQICENYPNLSAEWLLTGRGEMLKLVGDVLTIENSKGNQQFINFITKQQDLITDLTATNKRLSKLLETERGQKKSTANSGSTSKTQPSYRKTG